MVSTAPNVAWQFVREGLDSTLRVVAISAPDTLADYPDEVRSDQPVGYWRLVDDSAGEGDPAKDETGPHT
jgi:hypothetical protein